MSDDPDSALHTVATPKQARSQRTLERILDAAESLIEQRGVAHVSVAQIVRAAGSSVGGFYGRFHDKGELLRALNERYLRHVGGRLDELARPSHWGDAPLSEITRRCLGELVLAFREHPRLFAAFMAESAKDPAAWQSGERFRRRLIDTFAAIMLMRRAELRGHDDPELAARFAAHVALGLCEQEVLYGPTLAPTGDPLPATTLVAHMNRTVLAYLGVAPAQGVTP